MDRAGEAAAGRRGTGVLVGEVEEVGDLFADRGVVALEVEGETGEGDRLGHLALGEGAADRGRQMGDDACERRVERVARTGRGTEVDGLLAGEEPRDLAAG